MSHLDCRVYYDSTRQPAPPADCGGRVDLATDLDAAGRLARLGLSAATDLPAVLLTEPDGKIRIVAVRLSAEETARLATGQGIHSDNVVVYSSSWCPDCRRAKRVLEEAAAPFAEVDIDQDHAAEAMVLERSGGRRVVPTLRFDDRVWAFNPAPPLLRRLLNGRAKVQTRPLKVTAEEVGDC
jgi:mycoredoxin